MLNTNSGAIVAFATIALVVATAILAYFNQKLAYFNQKLWGTRDKPYLYFYTKNPGYVGHETERWLYVKNVGKGIALHVYFKDENDDFEELFGQLPVNEKRELKKVNGSGIEIHVSYYDMNEYEYSQDIDDTDVDNL